MFGMSGQCVIVQQSPQFQRLRKDTLVWRSGAVSTGLGEEHSTQAKRAKVLGATQIAHQSSEFRGKSPRFDQNRVMSDDIDSTCQRHATKLPKGE